MMPKIIPTFNDRTTEYNVVLNGVVFYIRTYFNEYAGMWFLDLKDSNNDPFAMGLALVPNINILRYRRELTATIGELRIVDTTGDGNTTSESLGTSSILYYFTPGEFETLFPEFNVVIVRDQQFVFSELFTVVS